MSDNFDKQLGSALSILRKRANLTQDEVGKRMGIGKAAVSHYETGTRSMYAETLQSYCKAIGCKIQDAYDLMDKLGNK